MIRSESFEVYYPNEDVVSLNSVDLSNLKSIAQISDRHCARICAHRSPDDLLQEMFIVQTDKATVKIHSHIDKIESIFVLEGEADLLFFDVEGRLSRVVELGPIGSLKTHYFRIEKCVFHSLSIKSDFFVYHEVTHGPFRGEQTVCL